MSVKKNFLSLWSGSRGWDRNPPPLDSSEDASHYEESPEYYEWWYFDSHFDNGYALVMTWHYRNMFMRPHIPTIQTMIYRPDGKNITRFWQFPPEDCKASKERCRVQMGDSSAEDLKGEYRIYMKIKEVEVDLIFRNLVPGWKPGTGMLYHDPLAGQHMGWVVPVPRGEVRGRLSISNEIIELEGYGYHDHNWGNFPPYEQFRGWYWGRLFDKKFTMIYGWVIPEEEEMPTVSPFMLARDGNILVSTDQIRLIPECWVRDEETYPEYPKKIHISVPVDGSTAVLQLNTKRTVEQMELPPATEWKQYYYRFLADYDAKILLNGSEEVIRGQTLHELVLLR